MKGYKPINQLGEGGYGIIYEAIQESTNKKVAVKTIKLQDGIDKQERAKKIRRFEREIQLCSSLSHPNIVQILDCGLDDNDVPFIVFELVEGNTLKELIGTNSLEIHEVCDILEQVIGALLSAHENGVIHRDLKPQNIMVFKSGNKHHAKILDFGIGTFINDVWYKKDDQLTLSQDILGTPRYCSPEQLRGELPTVKSDIYAWGLIYLEGLTGVPVFNGSGMAEVLQQQLANVSINLPSSLVEHDLGKLLRRVLEKNPDKRIANAEIILDELKQINYNTLIGKISNAFEADTELPNENTEVNSSNTESSRKNITILCLKLNLKAKDKHEEELTDAILADQINLCKDTATKYGAYLAGKLMNHLVFYFGYPNTSDTDTRRAASTALQILKDVTKRSKSLSELHKISLEVQMALNSGIILTSETSALEGTLVSDTLEILAVTQIGEIFLSEATSKKIQLSHTSEYVDASSNPGKPERLYRLLGEKNFQTNSFQEIRQYSQHIIGRDREIATIKSFWESDESKKLLIISGEAGIGKSRIAYELKSQLLNDGKTVKECKCLPEYRNNSLHPFLELLRSELQLTKYDADKQVRILNEAFDQIPCDISQILPVLCSWLNLPYEVAINTLNLSPAKQIEVIFESIYLLLNKFGAKSEYLFIIEDIHWIDLTSLSFIEALATKEHLSFKCLLLTRQLWNTDDIESKFEHIELKNLNSETTELYARNQFLNKKTAANVLHFIVNKSDGIPLYIEELTQMLLEEKLVISKEGVLGFADEFDERLMPETLKDLLFSRLDRLGYVKKTLQTAAVIGREFDYILLTKLMLSDEEQVQNNLKILVDKGLLLRRTTLNSDTYIFRHALIRDVAYESMITQVKKDLHDHLFTILEDEYSQFSEQNPAQMANHASQAGRTEDCVRYSVLSIKNLTDKSLLAEAETYAERFRKWVANIEDPLLKSLSELKLNIGLLPLIAVSEGWGSEKSKNLIDDNIDLIEAIKQNGTDNELPELNEQVLRSEWMQFSWFNSQMEQGKAMDIGYRLLNRLDLKSNHRLRMVVLAFLGQLHINDCDFDNAKKLLSEVVEGYKTSEDREVHFEFGFEPLVQSLGLLGLVEMMLGNIEQSFTHAKEALKFADSLKNPNVSAVAALLAALIYIRVEMRPEAKQVLDELYDKHGNDIRGSYVEVVLFFVLDWINNETERSETALQNLRSINNYNSLSWYECVLIETMLKCGAYDKANAVIDSTLERCGRLKEQYSVSLLQKLKAQLIYESGTIFTQEVKALLLDAIGHARKYGLFYYEYQTCKYFERICDESDKELAMQLIKDCTKKDFSFINDQNQINV